MAKLIISLSSKQVVEELYDFRHPDKWVKIAINMPKKVDGEQAITKLNGRKVLISFWNIPSPKYTLGVFQHEDSLKADQVLTYTVKQVSDARGTAAEWLHSGHL